jgi:hypothetical protein
MGLSFICKKTEIWLNQSGQHPQTSTGVPLSGFHSPKHAF